MEQSKFEYNQETSFDGNMSMASGMPSGYDMGMGMNTMGSCCMPSQTMMCQPIQECPQERVCHRYINYEVPHIMPCNTRIINHHIYRHTYTPYYTSCEENVVSNVYDRNCCN